MTMKESIIKVQHDLGFLESDLREALKTAGEKEAHLLYELNRTVDQAKKQLAEIIKITGA